MSQRNTTQGLPYVGIATLAAAAFGAGVLLTAARPTAILNTWYLTRAAGLVAYLLLWASVAVGLLQSSGFLKGATSPLANIDIHSFVSVGALYATTFHMVILVWDKYVPFSWGEMLLPFTSAYKPVLTGLGGVAFYISLGVSITTYLRAKIPTKAWRPIHLTSLAAFLFALLHGWLMGTDSASPAVSFLYRFTGLSVLALLVYRVIEVRRRAGSAGGR